MGSVTDGMMKKAAEADGVMKKAADSTFTITPAENNSEKADLLERIDGAIKFDAEKLFSIIDRLASNKKQVCDLIQLRSEVESGNIGEGAKAFVERALKFMW